MKINKTGVVIGSILILIFGSLVIANYWDEHPEETPCWMNNYIFTQLSMNNTYSQQVLLRHDECNLNPQTEAKNDSRI